MSTKLLLLVVGHGVCRTLSKSVCNILFKQRNLAVELRIWPGCGGRVGREGLP